MKYLGEMCKHGKKSVQGRCTELVWKQELILFLEKTEP